MKTQTVDNLAAALRAVLDQVIVPGDVSPLDGIAAQDAAHALAAYDAECRDLAHAIGDAVAALDSCATPGSLQAHARDNLARFLPSVMARAQA